MARPLIQMALDYLDFCSVENSKTTTIYTICGRTYKLKQMPQIEPIPQKKMPLEHLNKSAYKAKK